MRIKRDRKMETPFYYQHENYLIIFCETIEEFEKYKGDIRCMDVKSERWDSLIPQIYIDEMNEEILIQKCKKIIYGLSYQTERSNWFEYAKQYGKEIDIQNDLQIMKYEDLPKKQIEKEIQKIQLKREFDTNHVLPKINMITYIRRMSGNDMYYQLQIKCILENYKHHQVKNILVVGMGVEDTFQKISYEKISAKQLILINDDDDNISFMDLFTIANSVFQDEMVMILRSDTIFLQNDDLSSLWMNFYESSKKIISISRLERDIQGRVIRQSPQQTCMGGLEQDAWIIKTPIQFKEEKDIEMIQKIDFYERWSELYMNHYMKKIGYTIFHDTREFKILRICIHPNMEERNIIKTPSQPLDKEKIEMLPDISYTDMITMEQWMQMMSCNDEEIYEMKKEWMNRFYKKRL